MEGEQKGRWGIRNPGRFRSLLAIGILDISVRNALLTFLPFLLLAKETPLSQVGFALTLLFVGGAVGKFVCGILAEWFGVIPMVIVTEALTALGIFALFFSPSAAVWFLLPFVGIVLNGTSSVLYATVAEIIPSASRSRGYGLYYAITLGSGAVAPVIFGLITDLLGLSFGIMSAACLALVTLPLSRKLKIKGHPEI
jgi:MFS family permease